MSRSLKCNNKPQTFPEKAIAFYYYGSSVGFAICIDTCDGGNGRGSTREEVNATITDLHGSVIQVFYYLLVFI